jgi:hypothetical protein
MTDYVAVMLNGVATGMGVLIAHELYDAFKNYRKHIKRGAEMIIFNKDKVDVEDDEKKSLL